MTANVFFNLLEQQGYSHTSDFLITRITREIYLDPDNLENPEIARKILIDYPLWFTDVNTSQPFELVPWTENHLAGILSSRYLLSKFIGDRQMTETSLDLLKTYINSRKQFGFSEFLSPTYIPYTVPGWLNIYDFIPSFRQDIEQLLDTLCYQVATVCNPFNGNFMSTCTRMYLRNLNMRYYSSSNMTNLTRYLCGLGLREEKVIEQSSLTRALHTTTYKVKSNVSDIIDLRKLQDVDIKLVNPDHSINNKTFNKLPGWIRWSYGEYVNSDTVFSTLFFMKDYNLFNHKQFKILNLLEWSVIRGFVYVMTFMFYPFVYFFVRKYVKFPSILGMGANVVSRSHNDDCLTLSFMTGNTNEGHLGAQQQYWMLTTNSGFITSVYGTPSVGQKQMTGNTSQPYVSFEDERLSVKYIPDLTLKGWNGNDSISIRIEGMNYDQSTVDGLDVYDVKSDGFLITITVSEDKKSIQVSWDRLPDDDLV